jgi:type IV secretion system protein VirB5
MATRLISLLLSALLSLLPPAVARAQFAVIDVGAITQLLAQARTLEQQLLTAQSELAQAQMQLASMTGTRGMERLLVGTQRNYLPTSWNELEGVLSASSGRFANLSAGVATSIQANAVLTPLQLASLPTDARGQVDEARDLAAVSQNLAREALQMTSGRFESLQQLIAALPGAVDQKAVLDLQARIAAENAMLQNEQTKLQTIDRVLGAELQVGRERTWERTIAGHGQFVTRFEPVP